MQLQRENARMWTKFIQPTIKSASLGQFVEKTSKNYSNFYQSIVTTMGNIREISKIGRQPMMYRTNLSKCLKFFDSS